MHVHFPSSEIIELRKKPCEKTFLLPFNFHPSYNFPTSANPRISHTNEPFLPWLTGEISVNVRKKRASFHEPPSSLAMAFVINHSAGKTWLVKGHAIILHSRYSYFTGFHPPWISLCYISPLSKLPDTLPRWPSPPLFFSLSLLISFPIPLHKPQLFNGPLSRALIPPPHQRYQISEISRGGSLLVIYRSVNGRGRGGKLAPRWEKGETRAWPRPGNVKRVFMRADVQRKPPIWNAHSTRRG